MPAIYSPPARLTSTFVLSRGILAISPVCTVDKTGLLGFNDDRVHSPVASPSPLGFSSYEWAHRRLRVLLTTGELLMKKKSSALLIVASLVFATTTHAQTNTCTGFGSFFKDRWEELYSVVHPIGEEALKLIPVVGQNQEAVQAISKASLEFHNFVFNENKQSWTTIGAREIPVLKDLTTQGGTIQRIGPVSGVRVFTTSPLLWDSAEISINKQDGRLKTEIIICTFDAETGAKNIVQNYTFSNGKSLGSKKFVIPNVYGKAISVKLLGQGTSLNKFQYRIQTKGILNIDKQRQRALEYNGVTTSSLQRGMKIPKK